MGGPPTHWRSALHPSTGEPSSGSRFSQMSADIYHIFLCRSYRSIAMISLLRSSGFCSFDDILTCWPSVISKLRYTYFRLKICTQWPLCSSSPSPGNERSASSWSLTHPPFITVSCSDCSTRKSSLALRMKSIVWLMTSEIKLKVLEYIVLYCTIFTRVQINTDKFSVHLVDMHVGIENELFIQDECFNDLISYAT